MRDGLRAGHGGALFEHRQRDGGGDEGVLLGVQRFLAQDAVVEVAEVLARIDPQVVGEDVFHAAVGRQCVGLAVVEVVGRDQLGPQLLAVGVFGGQRLELGDDVRRPSASELGFSLREE